MLRGVGVPVRQDDDGFLSRLRFEYRRLRREPVRADGVVLGVRRSNSRGEAQLWSGEREIRGRPVSEELVAVLDRLLAQ